MWVARNKKPADLEGMRVSDESLAEWTGLEPATPGVTGRYSNQLNYHSSKPWRPHGDSNPGYRRERAVS